MVVDCNCLSAAFPRQGPSEYLWMRREKSWKEQITILKYRPRFQIFLGISWEILSVNLQYWSDFRNLMFL